ncbi:MAG: hypothetical protein ACFB10_11965 [Salibacteraceae bacterium]
MLLSCQEVVKNDPFFLAEPYAIEHFEFLVEDGDSLLRLYVNRNLTPEDRPDVVFRAFNEDTSTYYGTAILRLSDATTQNKIWDIPLPIAEDPSLEKSANQSWANKKFNELMRLHLSGEQTLNYFRHHWYYGGNWERNMLVYGTDFVLPNDHLLKFRPEYVQPGKKYKAYFDGYYRGFSIFRNFQGHYDETSGKEGKWSWYYTHGNGLMATATFQNDSLISPLVSYYYSGEKKDSAVYDPEADLNITTYRFHKNGTPSMIYTDSGWVMFDSTGNEVKPPWY